MINGISGKPGGGKSYEAVVTHIIKVVTVDRRKVVTNLPLQVDAFCSVYGDYCRDLIDIVDGEFHNYGGERPFSKKDHYLQYEEWQNEKGQKTYFFIDECHLAMPMQGTEKELKEFFSMHRHYGFDIMLITQNFRKVDRDIRDMVQNHYRCIKKSMLGQDNKYILKVHDGASSSNQSVVATHDREYEQKYFKFYQSHTKSNQSVVEATSNDVQIWWKHWSIKASVVFFLFGAFILTKAFSDKPEKKQYSDDVQQQLEKVAPEIVEPNSSVDVNSKNKSKPEKQRKLTVREEEYEQMLAESKAYHPFYKVSLHVKGFSEDVNYKLYYFSASQNGQHVFTISSKDLMLAGYEVRAFSDCAVQIKYHDYKDFLTCDSPTQEVNMSGDNLVASN